MKRRFMAGKLSLVDLVTTPEGRDKLKQPINPVVYDESTTGPNSLSYNDPVQLVIMDSPTTSYILAITSYLSAITS